MEGREERRKRWRSQRCMNAQIAIMATAGTPSASSVSGLAPYLSNSITMER